jgi:hypothetical protein
MSWQGPRAVPERVLQNWCGGITTRISFRYNRDTDLPELGDYELD